jgi:hypothetical protein
LVAELCDSETANCCDLRPEKACASSSALDPGRIANLRQEGAIETTPTGGCGSPAQSFRWQRAFHLSFDEASLVDNVLVLF